MQQNKLHSCNLIKILSDSNCRMESDDILMFHNLHTHPRTIYFLIYFDVVLSFVCFFSIFFRLILFHDFLSYNLINLTMHDTLIDTFKLNYDAEYGCMARVVWCCMTKYFPPLFFSISCHVNFPRYGNNSRRCTKQNWNCTTAKTVACLCCLLVVTHKFGFPPFFVLFFVALHLMNNESFFLPNSFVFVTFSINFLQSMPLEPLMN